MIDSNPLMSSSWISHGAKLAIVCRLFTCCVILFFSRVFCVLTLLFVTTLTRYLPLIISSLNSKYPCSPMSSMSVTVQSSFSSALMSFTWIIGYSTVCVPSLSVMVFVCSFGAYCVMLSKEHVSICVRNRSSFSSTLASLVALAFSMISTVPSCGATAWYVDLRFSHVSCTTSSSRSVSIDAYFCMSGLYWNVLMFCMSQLNCRIPTSPGLFRYSDDRVLLFHAMMFGHHILLWASRSCNISALYALRYLTFAGIHLQ